MIDYVTGRLEQSQPTFAVIEVNGIGYRIHISLFTYEQIQNHKEVKLLTHFHVTENAQSLFGFFDESERSLFKNLISISGIGPNTARTMLSSMRPSEIKLAIVSGDVNTIKKMKGIGPKTAQRVILELKDKLTLNNENELISGLKHNTNSEEALSALLSLGFSKSDASKAVRSAIDAGENSSVEAIIKQALKSF